MIDLLFRLARTRPGGACLAWMFAHMDFALPINRLRETPTLLAFRHPKPVHAFHVLLVPRRELHALADLAESDAGFLMDVFTTVQSLVAEYDLEQHGYSLIVNGGKYQEVGMLHFHLISDHYEEGN